MTDAANHGRRRRVGRWARGFLAATLLAPACSAPPDRPPAPTNPLQGSAPSGAVTPPITFQWSGNTPDGVVRLSIEDRAQRPVFAFPARGTSAAAPPGLTALLTRGERFTWTVASVDDNGETSRTSKPVEFKVE